MTPQPDTSHDQYRTDSCHPFTAPLRRLDGSGECRRIAYPDTCATCRPCIPHGDGYLLGRRAGTWNVICAPRAAVST